MKQIQGIIISNYHHLPYNYFQYETTHVIEHIFKKTITHTIITL